MKFTGIVTKVLPIQSGTSKAGKEWRRLEFVLEYESHEQYPKSIVVSAMNAKIEELNIQQGGKYEVEVDFSTREYQGRWYMGASAWKATKLEGQTAQSNTQAAQEMSALQSLGVDPNTKPITSTPAPESDDLPF